VDDTRAVVAALPTIDPNSPLGRVVRRADFRKFGVAGHSMGGVTAAEYCLGEPRCAAVVNLDGSPQYGRMIDQRLGRPLMMVYSARKGRLGASDAIYSRTASKYYRADVDGTLHLDFTDMALWPPLAERKALGPLDPAKKIAITRRLVREFFDQELRGRPSAVLAGKERLPDVTITPG
jgi:pimeloyl-ACP methyl ester carboxylesterase